MDILRDVDNGRSYERQKKTIVPLVWSPVLASAEIIDNILSDYFLANIILANNPNISLCSIGFKKLSIFCSN